MAAVLSVRDLWFQYGATACLQAIDFELYPGEILAILGQNGSGKSTLLNLMDGVLQPSRGEIRLRGVPLSVLNRSAIARQVAMVPQESSFSFAFSALQVVLMGRFPHQRFFSFDGEADLRIAREALDLTHCADLVHRSIQTLSGGERQRVLLARALAQEPQVLLLDEPTAFLDLRHKGELFRLLVQLATRKGLAVALVSHDLDLVAQYSSRVLLLHGGKILALGKPAQVLTAAHLRTAFGCPVQVDLHPRTGRPRIHLL